MDIAKDPMPTLEEMVETYFQTCAKGLGISSATNRLITSKDHASVQVNIGHLDENGIYTGQFTTFALCGFVRAQGDADGAVDRLWQKKKVEARQ